MRRERLMKVLKAIHGDDADIKLTDLSNSLVTKIEIVDAKGLPFLYEIPDTAVMQGDSVIFDLLLACKELQEID